MYFKNIQCSVAKNNEIDFISCCYNQIRFNSTLSYRETSWYQPMNSHPLFNPKTPFTHTLGQRPNFRVAFKVLHVIATTHYCKLYDCSFRFKTSIKALFDNSSWKIQHFSCGQVNLSVLSVTYISLEIKIEPI